MKKPIIKTFIPISAVAAVFGLAASAQAATTPVFTYDFPASWNGTGTAVTDLSTAHNNGVTSGAPALSSSLPSWGTGNSLDTHAGGILTSAVDLLNNSTVLTHHGFSMACSFMWDGTDYTSFGHTEKLIDYSGTESLQLVTSAGSASLQMQVQGDTGSIKTIPVSTTVVPNTWYNVLLTFGNTSSVGTGDVQGTVDLYVNGNLLSSGSATKGTYGDGRSRPIGIGQLGAGFGYLVGFKGEIYDPTVTLGVMAVPEPTSLALGALGGLTLLGLRRRKA